MKKLLFAFLLLAAASSALVAQEGEKGMKDANRAFNSYKLDQMGNKGRLADAIAAVDIATADAATASQYRTWQLCGDIYNEVAAQQINARQLAAGGLALGAAADPSTLPKVDHPGLKAAEAYTKALEMAVKKPEIRDALSGMRALQNNLQNLGFIQYEEQDFESAFRSFAAGLEMHDHLKKNNEQSHFDEEGQYEEQLYNLGLIGVAAGLKEDAKKNFMKLYTMKADKPAMYEGLYSIEADEISPEAAYKYLEEGRKRYPNDISLLFAEINHFLRIGKLDALLDELKTAISLEPDNVSLYTTMGSVYDNLYQNEIQAGNIEKAEAYSASALDYFNQALAKDPNNVDALYSIGALYYNKAASMTQDLAKLADDYSRAGTEKYNVKQAEMIAQFDLALPFFQKSESINPNDRNALIALKEIYAKKNELEMSNEFKDRLEKLEAGEKIEKSYFKK